MIKKIKENATKLLATVNAALTIISARAITSVYCSDAFAQVTTASNNLQEKFVGVAGALVPLAMVFSGLCWILSKDQKKADEAKHWTISIACAYLFIILVSKGTIVSTIKNLLP